MRVNKRIPLRSIKNLLCCLLAALAAAACINPDTQFHSYRTLPARGWHQTDTLHFTLRLDDSLALYKIWVEIRHRNEYPYLNLAMLLTAQPDGEEQCYADTLTCTMMQPDGKWKGDGWGGLYEVSFACANLRAPRTGEYHFMLSHCMRDTLLSGINDAGIRIEKAVNGYGSRAVSPAPDNPVDAAPR